MIEIYKIVSGKCDCSAAPALPRPDSYVTNGHDLKLQKVERSITYVNSFSLIEWLTSGISYRSMWCMLTP